MAIYCDRLDKPIFIPGQNPEVLKAAKKEMLINPPASLLPLNNGDVIVFSNDIEVPPYKQLVRNIITLVVESPYRALVHSSLIELSYGQAYLNFNREGLISLTSLYVGKNEPIKIFPILLPQVVRRMEIFKIPEITFGHLLYGILYWKESIPDSSAS